MRKCKVKIRQLKRIEKLKQKLIHTDIKFHHDIDVMLSHDMKFNDNYSANCDTYKLKYSTLSKYNTVNSNTFKHSTN